MNQSQQLTCGHVLLGGGHHDHRGVHGARGVHVQLESVIVLLDYKRISYERFCCYTESVGRIILPENPLTLSVLRTV